MRDAAAAYEAHSAWVLGAMFPEPRPAATPIPRWLTHPDTEEDALRAVVNMVAPMW